MNHFGNGEPTVEAHVQISCFNSHYPDLVIEKTSKRIDSKRTVGMAYSIQCNTCSLLLSRPLHVSAIHRSVARIPTLLLPLLLSFSLPPLHMTTLLFGSDSERHSSSRLAILEVLLDISPRFSLQCKILLVNFALFAPAILVLQALDNDLFPPKDKRGAITCRALLLVFFNVGMTCTSGSE